MIKTTVCLVALLFLLLSSGPMADGQREFIIDVPGATLTRVLGLNAQGDVCGGTQVNGVRLAFAGSRQADFTDLTTFAYPGSVFTQCRGINAVGQMVGVYQSTDTKSHAFVRDGPEFISIDVPGATDTRGFGIDPRGQISRTSIVRYTGVRKALADIGRELRVDAVVEGSVVRSGNRIRITAQLVHVASDRHLWAQAFDRDVHDALA